MKTAMIFGITGQDGSYLAELLLENDYKVVGITRRVSVDTLERIRHLQNSARLVIEEGDVTDCFCISNLMKKHRPEEIYNLSAQSHVGVSFTQPSLTWDVTAGGCLNILEAIRYSGMCQTAKFYQASSSEMFGKNYSVLDSDRGKKKYQNEDTPFMPQSPYAIAKLAAHHLVRNYRDSYGVFGCCGILFNHESERRGENFVTRKITKYIAGLMGGLQEALSNIEDVYEYNDDTLAWPPPIDAKKQICTYPKLRLGNLDARRDWGHAEDYVRAMWLMLQKNVPDDYVIATGKTYSVREFLDEAFLYVGIDDWTDYVVVDPKFYRPAEVDYLLGDSSKAAIELMWKPDVDFTALVRRMVQNDVEQERLQRSSLQGLSHQGVETR